MTREESLKILRDIHDKALFSVRNALETLIPELRESEDEMVRKKLIDFASTYLFWDLLGLTREQVISYLEKQKEQKPITESKRLANEVIEYLTRCGYSPVLKDDSKKEHFHIDIPRHKDDFWQSEEYKHCRSVLGEYYMEGDYGGDTYTLYIWRAKKEQKPADSVSKEEYVKRFKALCDAYEIKLPNREYDIYHLCDDLSKLSIDSGKQKPAEWSEDDDTNLNRIIRVLEDNESDWKELSDWLKSLRPSWKPSEEQLVEGLEEEIDRFENWMETYNQTDYPTSYTTRDIARHFAEWGAKQVKSND